MIRHRAVIIASHGRLLDGELWIPKRPRGVVLFAQGGREGRGDPQDRFVARVLESLGLVTLRLDLLPAEEQLASEWSEDVYGLVEREAARLLSARGWAASDDELAGLPTGYFGSGVGVGAALLAAAWDPKGVFAVVGRGGRPELAAGALRHVRAPTLLILGEEDRALLELNLRALDAMRCPHELRRVPGAGHYFEEPGALAHVAELAGGWFQHHLSRGPGVAATSPFGSPGAAG